MSFSLRRLEERLRLLLPLLFSWADELVEEFEAVVLERDRGRRVLPILWGLGV